MAFAGGTPASLSGHRGDYITLAHGAGFGHTIDATGVSFDGLTGATAAVAQDFAVEDKITDSLDDATLDYVKIAAGDVFVTQKSEPTNGGTIARGITQAGTGDTVYVQAGTYAGPVDAHAKTLTLQIGTGPGRVTVNGNFILTASDTLKAVIDGTTPARQFVQWVINGNVTLNNANLVRVVGSFVFGSSDVFAIVPNNGGGNVVYGGSRSTSRLIAYAGAGNDVLLGGAGTATLYGGTGHAIVIGGTLSGYSYKPLLALAAQWAAGNTSQELALKAAITAGVADALYAGTGPTWGLATAVGFAGGWGSPNKKTTL